MLRRSFLLVGVVAVLSASLPISVAAGACSTGEQGIFVHGTSQSADTHGTRSRLTWFDRNLDQDCQGLTGSTAFMSKGEAGTAGFGTWIEVGYRHYQTCTSGGNWCYFTEKGHGFTPTQITEYSFGPTPPNFGSSDTYRVNAQPKNPNGSTDWRMQVDPNEDGNFLSLDVYNTEWHNGFAYGETFRFGNDTSPRDEQRQLQFKNDNDNWNAWPGQDCQVDTIPGWDWDRQSANDYDVNQSNHSC